MRRACVGLSQGPGHSNLGLVWVCRSLMLPQVAPQPPGCDSASGNSTVPVCLHFVGLLCSSWHLLTRWPRGREGPVSWGISLRGSTHMGFFLEGQELVTQSSNRIYPTPARPQGCAFAEGRKQDGPSSSS